MSWREVLGYVNPMEVNLTQNSHNTHNSLSSSHSAYIADSAEANSNLLEVLSSVCGQLNITPSEVYNALSAEDIEDWQHGHIDNDTLATFAESLLQQQNLKQGKVPANFNEIATCKQCGPVWLMFKGIVTGCPWCRNRLSGRPIPRPHPVHCSSCMNFERIDHPHLGHCMKGQPESLSGLWDTSQRSCNYWLPSINSK